MLNTARVLLSSRLKNYPSVFLPIAKLRENNKRRVVRPDTDIVIEGYWRCGNHFATYAFMNSQPGPVRVAHHFHAPAQLILGLRWGVPSLLLIREPSEAIASATVFLKETDPGPFIRFFNNFHRAVLTIADHLVISDFPRTVNQFGSVTAAVNKRFGKQYALFGDTPEECAEVERCIRGEHTKNMGAVTATLPLPSEEKAALKQRVMDTIHEARFRGLMDEAHGYYRTLLTHSIAD